jgi:hypothetical protein
MKFETSTRIPAEVVQQQEERLHKAGFLRDEGKLEVVNGPQFRSVQEWVKLAKSAVAPTGNPTACQIAYQAALALCGGDEICEAIAYAAYQACLKS